MLASHAIKARLAASSWRPFGRRKPWLVHGMGETLTITVNASNVLNMSEVLIVDASDKPMLAWGRGRFQRLYLNFEKEKLTKEGGYAVWLSGSTLRQDHIDSGQYECMSSIMNEWFTTVEDDTALTLLTIEHGGPLRISNDILTRL